MKKKYSSVLIFLGIVVVFVMWTDYNVDNFNYSSADFKRVSKIKYVLQWTSKSTQPFVFMKSEQKVFIESNCSIQNCYITSKPHLLGDVTAFDAILFHGPEITYKDIRSPRRSVKQKYFFVSKESSDNYPVNTKRYNRFFNSTWTYNLNSDVYFGDIIIRNKSSGEVLGPSASIPWMSIEDMLPITDDVKQKLSNKTVAAAWFVSNCHAKSKRFQLAMKMENELMKYNMSLHLYGKCGKRKCDRGSMATCLEMLQKDYYFYFAFENSLSEDYVTEKLLHSLQSYVVPVVFGGADYKRFMPDGIYLDALRLGPVPLAKNMYEIITDKEKYYSYFKWMNHYSFHDVSESPETNTYCKFCEAINDESWMNKSTVIENFKEWWNPKRDNWPSPI